MENDTLIYAMKMLTKAVEELNSTLREEEARPVEILCPACRQKHAGDAERRSTETCKELGIKSG